MNMLAPLRLLLIEDDLNVADQWVSAIKTLGQPVRPTRIDSEESLQEHLRDERFDLALCGTDASSVSLEHLIAAIHDAGRNTPVLALGRGTDADVVECMRAGAQDLIEKDNIEHLQLAVQRTVESQRQRQQLLHVEASLREAEKRCRTLLDSSRDAIAYVHEGMHLYANGAYLALLGLATLDDIEGTPILDMVAQEDQDECKEFLRNYTKNPTSGASLTARLHSGSGRPEPVEMEFSPASVDGEPCTQVLIRDKNNTRALEQQLTYLSQRDIVTGLYNRRHLIERLEAAIDIAARGKGNSGLAMITLENFGEIRNQLGVAGSDIVLGDMGKALEATCNGEGGMVAHLEGEIFVILTHHWEPAALDAFVRGLLDKIRGQASEVNGRSIMCTASGGGAAVTETSADANEMIARVQTACAQAASCNGHVMIYRPKAGEMSQKQLDEHWCGRLGQALQEDRFKLLYQAVIGLRDDTKPRYNVYLRMIDPESGTLVRPKEFLPSAERSGIAAAIDRWVISHSLEQMKIMRAREKEAAFFIYLSGGVFHDPEMVGWIADQIELSGVPLPSVIFKMKEATVLGDLRAAKDFLAAIRNMGCGVALDDFGSGLNPFQIVEYIPVDYLKIDADFMTNIAANNENQETLQKLTESAKKSGKLIIVPNVEEAAALSVLWNMGVHFAQGYFIHHPSEVPDYDFSSI